MRAADVDASYVDRWAGELGVSELWNDVRATGQRE